MSPSDSPASRDELRPPSGDQARKAAMPDDIVAMIFQHRRERASAPRAREPRRWWSWPSSRRTFLIVLALAVVGTGIARLAPRQGILLLICALSVWAWRFLRAEWKKGEKSPFFIFILPWIVLPVLAFAVPVALVIAAIIYILWFFLY
jgi:hypothetical protein